MPENGERPQLSPDTDGKFPLDLLFNPDVQERPISQEKKKVRPTLIASLEQIYENPTEDSFKLMQGFHEATNTFLALNSQFIYDRQNYYGCNTTLGFARFGPALGNITLHVLKKDTSLYTFGEAGILLALSTAGVAGINFILRPGVSDKLTSHLYEERKIKFQEVREKLSHQAKIVDAYFKLLGLEEDLQRSKQIYSFVNIATDVSNFFEQKQIEEDIKRQVNS